MQSFDGVLKAVYVVIIIAVIAFALIVLGYLFAAAQPLLDWMDASRLML
jgi:hypothetical protein